MSREPGYSLEPGMEHDVDIGFVTSPEVQSRERICLCCQTFKHVSAFNRISPSNSTLHPWCKACRYAPIEVKARALSQPLPNPSAVRKVAPAQVAINVATDSGTTENMHVRQKRTVKLRSKICVRCKAVKEASEFPQEPGQPSRLQAMCSECLVVSRRRTVRRAHVTPAARLSTPELQSSDNGEVDVEEDVVTAAAALGGLAAGVSASGVEWPCKSKLHLSAMHLKSESEPSGSASERLDGDGCAQLLPGTQAHIEPPRRSKRQVQHIKFDDIDSDWEVSEEVVKVPRQARGRKRLRVDEPTVQEKACTKCKLLKNASEFTRCSTHSTGLHPWCRDCTNEASKKRQEQMRRPGSGRSCGVFRHGTAQRSDPHPCKTVAAPARTPQATLVNPCDVKNLAASQPAEGVAAPGTSVASMSDLRRCTHCHVSKQAGDFYKCAAMTSGLHPWCKQCMKEVQRRNKRARPALPSME